MKKYMITNSNDLMAADEVTQKTIILPAKNDNVEVEHTDATDPDLDSEIEPIIFHRELIRRLSIIQKLAYNV